VPDQPDQNPSPRPAPSAAGGSAAGRGPDAGFTERLWPSPTTWLIAPGLGLGAGLSLFPIGEAPALVAALAVAVAAVVVLVRLSPVVAVGGGELRAGRATVPLALLGEPSWADGEEARQERGPRLDARAYLCIRGWVRPVVRIPLDDPADPTPYWLVSSRRPADLVAALEASRRS